MYVYVCVIQVQPDLGDLQAWVLEEVGELTSVAVSICELKLTIPSFQLNLDKPSPSRPTCFL